MPSSTFNLPDWIRINRHLLCHLIVLSSIVQQSFQEPPSPCELSCSHKLMEALEPLKSSNEWVKANSRLFVGDFSQDTFPQAAGAIIRTLGSSIEVMPEARKTICSEYKEHERCRAEECGKNLEEEEMSFKLQSLLCGDTEEKGKDVDCALTTLGGVGLECFEECEKNFEELNKNSFQELGQKDFTYYTNNGKTMLTELCKATHCLIKCLRPKLAENCSPEGQKIIPNALNEWAEVGRQKLEDTISSVALYFVWPTECDDLIQDTEEEEAEESEESEESGRLEDELFRDEL